MSRNPSRRVRIPNGPGLDDVLQAINAIYDDFGGNAEAHLFIDLAGDLLIEATCDCLIEGEGKRNFSYVRRVSPNGHTIDMTMMIAFHNLYGLIDRHHLRRI